MVKLDFYPCRNVVVLFFQTEKEANAFADSLRGEMRMQKLMKELKINRPLTIQPRRVG